MKSSVTSNKTVIKCLIIEMLLIIIKFRLTLINS